MDANSERRGLRPPAGVNSRPRQLILPLASELVVDLFAGAGVLGSSLHASICTVTIFDHHSLMAAELREQATCHTEQGVIRRAA